MIHPYSPFFFGESRLVFFSAETNTGVDNTKKIEKQFDDLLGWNFVELKTSINTQEKLLKLTQTLKENIETKTKAEKLVESAEKFKSSLSVGHLLVMEHIAPGTLKKLFILPEGKIDFAGNLEAERFIGLGHMVQPEEAFVKVHDTKINKDRFGILGRVKRGNYFVPGYVDVLTGDYIEVETNDRVVFASQKNTISGFPDKAQYFDTTETENDNFQDIFRYLELDGSEDRLINNDARKEIYAATIRDSEGGMQEHLDEMKLLSSVKFTSRFLLESDGKTIADMSRNYKNEKGETGIHTLFAKVQSDMQGVDPFYTHTYSMQDREKAVANAFTQVLGFENSQNPQSLRDQKIIAIFKAYKAKYIDKNQDGTSFGIYGNEDLGPLCIPYSVYKNSELNPFDVNSASEMVARAIANNAKDDDFLQSANELFGLSVSLPTIVPAISQDFQDGFNDAQKEMGSQRKLSTHEALQKAKELDFEVAKVRMQGIKEDTLVQARNFLNEIGYTQKGYITSGTGGVHSSPKSRHYKGEAIDLRTTKGHENLANVAREFLQRNHSNDIKGYRAGQPIYRWVENGYNYEVIVETSPPHLHFGIRYVGGAVTKSVPIPEKSIIRENQWVYGPELPSSLQSEYKKALENFSELYAHKNLDVQTRQTKTVLLVDPSTQKLYKIRGGRILNTYSVSTAKEGLGSRAGSDKTPTGTHIIGDGGMIGDGAEKGSIFRARKNTKEKAPIYTDKTDAAEDLVTSRIMWLDGLEAGKNTNSQNRFIYIHGTNEEGLIGQPVSHGCIRMTNNDVIELFNSVKGEDAPVVHIISNM